MRIPAAVLAASLVLGFAPGAWAAAGDLPAKEDGRAGGVTPPPAGSSASTADPRQTTPDDVAKPTRAEQLDSLFAMLKTAKDQAAAESAENQIAAIWLQSGSDTVDLLMEWTQDAVKEKDYPLALDYLDRILTLKPDYVEGWNTRATVYYMKEDYGRALADMEKTLALEPRHFAALTGLGTIMREIGDDKRALEVYRKVIAIDPFVPSVQDAIDELSGKGADGRDI